MSRPQSPAVASAPARPSIVGAELHRPMAANPGDPLLASVNVVTWIPWLATLPSAALIFALVPSLRSGSTVASAHPVPCFTSRLENTWTHCGCLHGTEQWCHCHPPISPEISPCRIGIHVAKIVTRSVPRQPRYRVSQAGQRSCIQPDATNTTLD